MRARMRLNRRVRVLTTESRMSKHALIGIPLFLFLFLNITSPGYTEVFYTSFPGRCMLIGTGISMLLGAWVMGRLSVIHY